MPREAGWRATTGDIVINTDADITFPENWLQIVEKTFSDPGIDAITGGYLLSIDRTPPGEAVVLANFTNPNTGVAWFPNGGTASAGMSWTLNDQPVVTSALTAAPNPVRTGKTVIFSSMLVDRWPAETAMVPVAFAVSTGLSLKEKVLGLGEGEWPGDVAWLGVGDEVEADPPPQAAAHIARAAIATDVMADLDAVLHRVPGIPVQVTGGGRNSIPSLPTSWGGWPGRDGPAGWGAWIRLLYA